MTKLIEKLVTIIIIAVVAIGVILFIPEEHAINGFIAYLIGTNYSLILDSGKQPTSTTVDTILYWFTMLCPLIVIVLVLPVSAGAFYLLGVATIKISKLYLVKN